MSGSHTVQNAGVGVSATAGRAATNSYLTAKSPHISYLTAKSPHISSDNGSKAVSW